MGEAMVAQSVLEAGGVPCRIGDLASIPSHLYGIAGGMGRSVGLWVLEIDVERASSLLASGGDGSHVDEAALAAEAMAAAPPAEGQAEEDPVVAMEENAPPPIAPTHPPWAGRALLILLIAGVALVASRGCS
jgi:hypothetical protein